MKKRKMPIFKTEDEERAFWATHDSAEFIDWSKAKPTVFPNLKPSTKTISLRLPESIIAALKVLANKRDVPYQSLLKIFLAEKVQEEMRQGHVKPASTKTAAQPPPIRLRPRGPVVAKVGRETASEIGTRVKTIFIHHRNRTPNRNPLSWRARLRLRLRLTSRTDKGLRGTRPPPPRQTRRKEGYCFQPGMGRRHPASPAGLARHSY